MISLSASVLYHAGQDGHRVAVAYQGQTITYHDLARRITCAAGMLQARGVGQGDVVALLMKNSAAFVELALAVSHIGAVLLPINYRLSAHEVLYILDHAGARLVFVDEELTGSVGGDARAVVLETRMQCDVTLLDPQAQPVAQPEPGEPDTLFRLMYTSGTTDRPKGVMHTYGNYYWKCLDHIVALGLSRDDKLLVVGPLYHVGAFDLPGVAVLMVGGCISILRDFDPSDVLEAISTQRLTCGWMAPVMLSRVLATPGAGRFDLSSFRWLIGGGERTPEERIREFSGVFRAGRYIDGYGLTETCSGDTLMTAGMEIAKIGSTGRPTPHVSIEIRDEFGQPLPPGAQGEICVRGPKVTRGYWRDEAKTRDSFHPGGWLRTGDIGYLDAQGYLYLTDRLKDMIISGGENIASSEVERAIYQLPEVSEVAVVGVPDAAWGERVVAVVVLRPGASFDESRIVAHSRTLLAGFKVPRQVLLRTELPRNPSGKVLKRRLREELS